jgi:hypothetical protein
LELVIQHLGDRGLPGSDRPVNQMVNPRCSIMRGSSFRRPQAAPWSLDVVEGKDRRPDVDEAETLHLAAG